MARKLRRQIRPAPVSRLRRSARALGRLLYGSRVYETWRFPPGSLRTAREALGLRIEQAYDLAYPRSVGGLQHRTDWIWVDRPKRPLHTEVVTVAVLIATGIAVRSRAAGSSRGMADLILFGPTPLSPYPRPPTVEFDSLDGGDLRHLGQAIHVLTEAAQLTGGHDDTTAAHHRVTDALLELDRWSSRV